MTYYDNFKSIWDVYVGIFLGYGTTLMCFPVLIFQLDISDIINKEYKFVFLCFVYSIGDITSRMIHSSIKIDNRFRLHFANFFKFMLVWVIWMFVHWVNKMIWFKIITVFLVGFFQGVIIVKYSLFGKKELKNNPYDLGRMGHISIGMIYMGLCLSLIHI